MRRQNTSPTIHTNATNDQHKIFVTWLVFLQITMQTLRHCNWLLHIKIDRQHNWDLKLYTEQLLPLINVSQLMNNASMARFLITAESGFMKTDRTISKSSAKRSSVSINSYAKLTQSSAVSNNYQTLIWWRRFNAAALASALTDDERTTFAAATTSATLQHDKIHYTAHTRITTTTSSVCVPPSCAVSTIKEGSRQAFWAYCYRHDIIKLYHAYDCRCV